MSSLKNIQRDAHWLNEVTVGNDIVFGTETAIGSSTKNFNANTGVQQSVVSAKSTKSLVVTTANNIKCIGGYINPPRDEPVPYRIKARATRDFKTYLVIGYLETDNGGTDDVVSQSNIIEFVGEFDDIVMIGSVDVTNSNYGKPIAIGVGVEGTTSSNPFVLLSVQHLGTAPPPFTMGVS